MSWEDILKGKVMSGYAKKLIKEVMITSSKKLTADEVKEKIIQLAERSYTNLRRVPTHSELATYLSKNYSFDIETRRHPIKGNREKKRVYFKEE